MPASSATSPSPSTISPTRCPMLYARRDDTALPARLAAEPAAQDRGRGHPGVLHGHAGRRARARPLGLSPLGQLPLGGRPWPRPARSREEAEKRARPRCARRARRARAHARRARVRTPKELAATEVIALPSRRRRPRCAAAARSDAPEDYALPVWAGEIPLGLRAGTPVTDPVHADARCVTVVAPAMPDYRGDRRPHSSSGGAWRWELICSDSARALARRVCRRSRSILVVQSAVSQRVGGGLVALARLRRGQGGLAAHLLGALGHLARRAPPRGAPRARPSRART